VNARLEEILEMAPDSKPRELASALELTRLTLQREARQGDPEAGQAMLRLRLAYLRWAYGTARAAS